MSEPTATATSARASALPAAAPSSPISPVPELRRTPLHALHLELGARMVPFAGYDMPVSYPAGILAEHRHCRAAAALFDVSHMGQLSLAGDAAAAALETLVPMDVQGLAPGRQRYAFFTNDAGGILDDLMITRREGDLLLIVNASCKDADTALLQGRIGAQCEVRPLPQLALLALQGPHAVDVLARLDPSVARLTFMTGGPARLAGADCHITRSGYTGEDGFEISVPAEQADALARALLAEAEVQPAGLGARDTLRLEAGLCLYGHDIDAGTTPVEAGLAWAIQKIRRPGGARAGGYPGADRIAVQLAGAPERRRVGLRGLGRVPVREGARLVNDAGDGVGHVTSGTLAPSAGHPVAMGYVDAGLAVPGRTVHAEVRGNRQPMEVVALPFVPHRYVRA